MSLLRPKSLHRMAKVFAAVFPAADPLSIVKTCGGYYECPKDASGKRLGPLVGYAGKYKDQDGDKQYVGDVYVNFAAVESFSVALGFIAHQLKEKLKGHRQFIDTFCGAPEGGKALANTMAGYGHYMYLYPEKKVTAVATKDAREQSELIFSRHEPIQGSKILLVEDVCNNFSTTAELIKLIEKYGATVVGIACFLNRSDTYTDLFTYTSADGSSKTIPIFSLVNKVFPQHRQNDPYVAEDIETGNVIWKPKNEWDKLEAAMEKADKVSVAIGQ